MSEPTNREASSATGNLGRHRVPLLDLPDGVAAVTIPRTGPTGPRVPLDRRGRLAARRVDLIADPLPPADADTPAGLSDGDVRWVLAAGSRRWESIQGRFGPAALDVALSLVRADAVVLRCEVRGELSLGRPLGWRLTEAWSRQASEIRSKAGADAEGWRRRAQRAAAAVHGIHPGLAAALSVARGSEPRLPVLVYAAEDLAAGITHDGPRAFSQAHFDHTKARDDAAEILAAAGASDASLLALGLRRSPYLGLGGPVVLDTGHTRLDLCLLDGPILLRADQRRQPALATTADVLLVVENLQAAEAACDTFPHVAVAWTAGQPADAALSLLASLAQVVDQVVIVPDADLGGVRIAQRVLTALPAHASTVIVDVGQQPHLPREPFGPASVAGLQAALTGPAADLAAACLARGYPIEQEAATRAAVAAVLGHIRE
jgi:Protein of unknown function C-terminus (DUF2399)